MTETNQATPESGASSDVCSAAEALKRAKAEFEKAQAFYESVCRQASEQLKTVRETSVGDVVDGTLKTVKRYPGTSLTIAAFIGFYLGRLFRR